MSTTVRFRGKAHERLIAMKLASNADDTTTVIYTACTIYQSLLKIANGKNNVEVRVNGKIYDLDLRPSEPE